MHVCWRMFLNYYQGDTYNNIYLNNLNIWKYNIENIMLRDYTSYTTILLIISYPIYIMLSIIISLIYVFCIA